MKPVISSRLLRSGVLITLSTIGLQAGAAGFQISEQTVAGMGQAFAGAGIARDDASNLFYNPGGLMANPNRQLQLGASLIKASTRFSNDGSTRRFAGVTVPSDGIDADGGEDVTVPNFYFTSKGEQLKWGIGISAPFGLATSYPEAWVGRYHALRSDLEGVNVNPAVAVRLSDRISAGAGVSIQRIEAELSQAVFTGPGRTDGRAVLKGDDTEVGFNLGIMAEPSERTRIGVGYRSRIKHRLQGKARFSRVPGGLPDLPIEATAVFPETIYASVSHELGRQTEISGSIRWTRWSSLPELRIHTAGLPDSVADYRWQDVGMFSLGVRHGFGDDWTFRAGYARDESPVPADINRTPRVPDSDRDWFTLGLSKAISERMRLDFAYARIEGRASSTLNTVDLVARSPGAFTDTLKGDYDSSVNIFGIQLYGEF